MKATDLMIWDWVYNSYHKKNIQWNYGEMFCPNGNPVIGKDLYPIPLTPEILEKNGFNHHGCVSKNEQYQVMIQHWSKDNLALNKVGKHGNPVFIPDLIYVHELQHALRLCGLYELADNFKI